MAENEFRAKFVALYQENQTALRRRQMPLAVDETLSVVVEFGSVQEFGDIGLKHKGSAANFLTKYNLFTEEELKMVLIVDEIMLYDLMSRVVPCVGCRRSIERFYNQLIDSGHPALDPLKISKTGEITLGNHYMCGPGPLASLFNRYGSRLNSFIESIPKTKKNRRCLLHSLDSQKVRPAGNWLDVWEQMSYECQEEVVIIERDVLLETLETYLRKHRFCGECKSKVLQAYNLLVEESDPNKEKDFVAGLYRGIRYCSVERHIHVHCNTDFVANLMSRAEPELRGSRLEKHAKTIDVAQEEVLVCIGICLYERLHRISQRMREEEQTWQIMFYLGIECLRTKFELTVEKKQGISQLELLCEEIRMAELAKQQKREHKRQKRKQRKDKLRNDLGASKMCHRKSICQCQEIAKDQLRLNKRSRSVSPGSIINKNDAAFPDDSLSHSSNDSGSSSPSLVISPIVTSSLSTCSCSSDRFLSDDLASCGDSGYLSGTNHDSPWSSSPSSSPCSCDGAYAESCCSHDDDCQNCSWTKTNPVNCDSQILDKCGHCIRRNLSPTEGIGDEVISYECPFSSETNGCILPSLEDLLKMFSPSEEEAYIPPEELQEMRVRVRQTSQERLKFRETLRRRFQDFQKLTKFRFRPFAFCKLSNHYVSAP